MHLLKRVVAITLLCGSGLLVSGASQCSPPATTCFFAEPASFQSIDELECGLGPDGVSLCHWSLSFDNGNFNWMHSDVGEAGTYSCDGDKVTGTTSYATYTGTWDEAQGVLTWDGVGYTVK